jgi:hypothetical protein
MDVLERYGQHKSKNGIEIPWAGREMYLPVVLKQVEIRRVIQMILPSFHWKSVGSSSLLASPR